MQYWITWILDPLMVLPLCSTWILNPLMVYICASAVWLLIYFMYMHLHTYMYTPGPAGGLSLTKGTHGRKMYTHAEFAWLATFYLPHTATVSSACLLANFCVVMCVVRVRTNGDSEYLRVCCPASLNKVNSLTFRQNGSSTFIYALRRRRQKDRLRHLLSMCVCVCV